MPCHETDSVNAFKEDFWPYRHEVFKAIDENLAAGKVVLTHCQNGAHRSAAVMFSYLKERCPEISCWKINCYLKSIRSQVQGLKEVLVRKQKSNMFNTAIRHYCGSELVQ